MRFRRRHPDESSDPVDRLWRDLVDWFREEDSSQHHGPDLTFGSLQLSEVERAWRFVTDRADPLDPAEMVWDGEEDREVSVVEAFERGVATAATRCGGIVSVKNVRTAGERLPWFGIWLNPDEFSLYWWVGDPGWEPRTVAAFAVFLDELRRLLPSAVITLEWDEDNTFWPAIDAYLATLTG